MIDAIYCDGVLKPVDTPSDEERQAAVRALFEETERMDFRLTGPPPTRDGLHERF